MGNALLDVWSAELSALGDDLGRSGRRLGVAGALLAAAAGFAFWAIGLGVWALVERIALEMARWQAALLVCGCALLLAGILAAIGVWRLRTIENPARTVGRRGREHVAWLQQNVVPGLLGGEAAPSDDESGR